MTPEPETLEDVLNARNGTHGDAWELTGEVIAQVPVIRIRLDKMVQSHPYMFLPWVTILCKLIRVLFSPTNLDHWMDIQGYAHLVHDKLIKETK